MAKQRTTQAPKARCYSNKEKTAPSYNKKQKTMKPTKKEQTKFTTHGTLSKVLDEWEDGEDWEG